MTPVKDRKISLFLEAEAMGIDRNDVVQILRDAGIEGTYDDTRYDEYLEVLREKAKKIRIESIMQKLSVPEKPKESVAEKATRALKALGQRKWVIPPVKKTPDGKYVIDPHDTVEGVVAYEGVENVR